MAGDRNKKNSAAADNVEEVPPGGTTGDALHGIMALLQTMQQQQLKQQEAMELQQKQQQQITEQLLRKLSLAPAATNPDGQAEGEEHANLPATKASQSGGDGDPQSVAGPGPAQSFGPEWLSPYDSMRQRHPQPGGPDATELSPNRDHNPILMETIERAQRTSAPRGWSGSRQSPEYLPMAEEGSTMWIHPPSDQHRMKGCMGEDSTARSYHCRDQSGHGQGRPRSAGHWTEPPRSKMATFEGTEKDDWDSFYSSFSRLAKRHHWTVEESLDRLHESLRGAATRFVSLLPEAVREDYSLLCGQLKSRFGWREPPSTSRQKLANITQGIRGREEFAEEVRKLAARAFPEASHTAQEQYAAEAFSRGLRNRKVALMVLNRAPTTVAQAEELAECFEHNYRATVREDKAHPRARRVTWIDEDAEDSGDEGPTIRRTTTPTYVTAEWVRSREDSMGRQLKKQLEEQQEEFQRKFEALERLLRKSSFPLDSPPRSRSPSPAPHRSARKASRRPRGVCFGCGEEGHFKRECSRSPSPAPRTVTPSENE